MCAKANPTAAGFSITGLLDTQSKTRERFPVVEIEASVITNHPNNAIYSMDEAGVAKLAASIKEHGLTDLPLVRKLDDGSWQMLSGHRRKAAYLLLASTDAAFSKIPCRVIEGIDSEQALLLLHSANYFTRQLSAAEFAAASAALGEEVERRRVADPTLKGVRTEDIKAEIIHEQTGQKISGKTLKRKEAMAEKIANQLSDEWQAAVDRDELTAAVIDTLACMPMEKQADIYCTLPEDLSKKEIASFIEKQSLGNPPVPDKNLQKALLLLEKCLAQGLKGDFEANDALAALIVSKAQELSQMSKLSAEMDKEA